MENLSLVIPMIIAGVIGIGWAFTVVVGLWLFERHLWRDTDRSEGDGMGKIDIDLR